MIFLKILSFGQNLTLLMCSFLKIHTFMYFNPNLPVGLVGKVQKKLSPEGERKGGWRKKRAQRARRAWGSNPGPAAC